MPYQSNGITVFITRIRQYVPSLQGFLKNVRASTHLYLSLRRTVVGKRWLAMRKLWTTVKHSYLWLCISCHAGGTKSKEGGFIWALLSGLYFGFCFLVQLYAHPIRRLALELKLNEPCDHSVNERERLNRMRTWLNCYCVDASHATQFGKPAMIAVEDYVARQSRNWYRTSQLNLPMDIHLVAYVEVLQTMGRFKKDAGDLSTNNDAVAVRTLLFKSLYANIQS